MKLSSKISLTLAGLAVGAMLAFGASVSAGGGLGEMCWDGTNYQLLKCSTTGLATNTGDTAAAAATGGTWSTPITVACSTVTASSATLVAGQVYEITSDIDMFIRPAASATTSWRPLWAKTYQYSRQVATGGAAGVIACITAAGTGTLYLTPITAAE